MTVDDSRRYRTAIDLRRNTFLEDDESIPSNNSTRTLKVQR